MRKMTLACLALLSATSAHAQEVYRNNFDPGGYFLAPGVTDSFSGLTQGATESAVVDGPINATGWAGNYWANRTGGTPTGTPSNVSVLELTNLPAHSSVTLQFLLGFLESWDSSDGNPSPDLLDITLNGSPLLTGLTANNGSGTVESYGGGSELFDGAQINALQSYSDTLVGYNLVFPHNSSTLSIGFGANGTGWQGGSDEGFGLDAFKISLDGVSGVPEPSTWAMMLFGFAALGVTLRRRRKQDGQVRFANA
jgi:hypothetical protein